MVSTNDKLMNIVSILHEHPAKSGSSQIGSSLILNNNLNRKQKRILANGSKCIDDSHKIKEQRAKKRHENSVIVESLRSKLKEKELS